MAATDLSRSVVHKHIQKLYRHGFVDYSAVGLTSQKTSFTILADPSLEYSTFTQRGRRERSQARYGGSLSLRNRVGTILAEARQHGQEAINYDELGDKLASSGEVNIDTLQGVIGVMLREGVIARRHKSPRENDAFSEIMLEAGQKEIIDRCNHVVTDLQAGNTEIVGKGLARGAMIMEDRDLVTQLLRRGYAHSPFTPD